MGPDGIRIGESLGVVARLLGDPGEDQMENLPDEEVRLWPESSWLSGVAGRYWYGLRAGMALRLVSVCWTVFQEGSRQLMRCVTVLAGKACVVY